MEWAWLFAVGEQMASCSEATSGCAAGNIYLPHAHMRNAIVLGVVCMYVRMYVKKF